MIVEKFIRECIVVIPIFFLATTAAKAECDQMLTPAANVLDYRGKKEIGLGWHLPYNCNDAVNLMWAVPAGTWHQQELSQDVCVPNDHSCLSYLDFNVDKPYIFKVQSCRTRTLASSVCSPWSKEAYLLPYGPDTCVDGFVWRDAVANDHICVSPQIRQQARQ